jgi:hypothetical protein
MYLLAAGVEPCSRSDVWSISALRQTEYLGIKLKRPISVSDIDGDMMHGEGLHGPHSGRRPLIQQALRASVGAE